MTHKFNFYYDESEHSRKINYATITAKNYYDNFITAIVGWNELHEKSIEQKYIDFENKYSDRKSDGELKSTTIKQAQIKNGFASLNKNNINFINDLLNLYTSDVYLYFSVTSKIEYIILQLFKNYKNKFLVDIDAMKYSIVKAILIYQPQDIISGMYKNTKQLVILLKKFFLERIDLNKANIKLKRDENRSFEDILLLLDDIDENININWNYNIAFFGFKKYIFEKEIDNYYLFIDQEGKEGNTLNAALNIGLTNVSEVNSKNFFGIRMADMLVGLITKIIKNLHQGFAYQSNEETLKKKLLSNEWFDINQKQLFLYHKMHIIINVLDHAWYKTYAGVYSDDLTVFIVFLNYMNNFETITDFNQIKNSDHAEYFNALCCEKLAEYYVRLRSKLSIEPITNNKTYFYNQKQAKIFFDISKQPVLKITNRNQIFDVLSVGISKEIIPLITILEGNTPLCFRLPLELLDWVTDCVNYANSGENLFPTKVMFNKKDDRYFANIL